MGIGMKVHTERRAVSRARPAAAAGLILPLAFSLAAAAAPQRPAAAPKATPAPVDFNREVLPILSQNCFACHLPGGEGMAGVFPPLAKSDYLMADRDRAIRIVLKGLSGPVTVNGQSYNGAMPPQSETLTAEQVADVLTYVTNSWGNSAPAFTTDEVRKVKGE